MSKRERERKERKEKNICIGVYVHMFIGDVMYIRCVSVCMYVCECVCVCVCVQLLLNVT